MVLEEIRMTQDNPEDLVHELFTQNFWHPHALGKPILGTPETVSAFTRDTLQAWFKQCYAPNRLVITAAGHLTHQQLVDLVSERFAKLPRAEEGFADPKPVPMQHITQRSKSELEQVHLCLGVPALPLTDRRRFTVSVMNNILGGGMSSRLFQNIRERQGLAYSIFSDLNPYRDTGIALGLRGHVARDHRKGRAVRARGIPPHARRAHRRRRASPRERSSRRAPRCCRSKAAARA